MLRTLKHAINSPRLLGVKATTAALVSTVNISSDDVVSAVSAATGKSVLTIGDVFQRAGVVVGAAYSSLGTRPYCKISATPTFDTATITTNNNNTDTDGVVNALILGYDSEESDYLGYVGQQIPRFPVFNAWNSPRIEVFKVTPHATTPAINIGSGRATLTRNGVGDYTLTFKRAFASDNVVAVPTVISSSAGSAAPVSTSALAARVLCTVAGSASDAVPFYVVVQGSDNPQYGARHRRATKVSDRLPRLIAGRVTYSAGTPSIVLGTGDFTIADTGTGQLGVTFNNPFAREPIVIANQDLAGAVTVNAAASVSAVQLNTFNNAAAATDAGELHFLVIGFDDVDEYFL
jgi:hypothetical protein